MINRGHEKTITTSLFVLGSSLVSRSFLWGYIIYWLCLSLGSFSLFSVVFSAVKIILCFSSERIGIQIKTYCELRTFAMVHLTIIIRNDNDRVRSFSRSYSPRWWRWGSCDNQASNELYALLGDWEVVRPSPNKQTHKIMMMAISMVF